jgi:peptidoglycan/LPS O-acetylase OafA/YrhL
VKLTYRPEIDGLRAIAVGAVILYHAKINIFGYQPFRGGFIGVDIFFVISGYLITSIILKELVTTGSFSFKHFYERRIRRILPALLFVMLASLPFAWMYLLPNSFIDFSKSILYSLGFSSNFYFHYSGQQYGAESGLLKPFLHTWSLSVEEQYYVLFPIVLLITFKYFRKYLIHILILGFVISLGLAEWGSRNHPSFNFYVLPTRGWELLAGSILAYFEITNGKRGENKTFNLILPSIGLLLIGHSILFFNDEMFHPSFYTLSPIIGVCLIIWFSNKNELITKILSTKLFVGIGLISYSLYLWHYPVFSFIRYYKWFYQDSEIVNFLKYFSILLIILFSIISYSFVEKKFRNKKFNFKKIFLILSICSLILIIYNFTIIFYDFHKTRFHPFFYKYDGEHTEFEVKYNYQNFSTKKNVFIIGNSFADNLLNILWNNKTLEKKYYFYTAVADDIGKHFQLECLKDFIEKKINNCDGHFFNFFEEQYKKSNYIIFAIRSNGFYLEDRFIETLKLLDADNKKFIVFLNDLHYADILDKYILINNKIPSFNKLEELEKEFFKKKKNYETKIIQLVKDKFKKKNIKYVTRSEIFCNYEEKKCPLIKNENKIFSVSGHITNNGAKYASNKIEILIKKLLD